MHTERFYDQLSRFVGGAVVHNDDLVHRIIYLHQRANVLDDVLLLVIGGNDERDRQKIVAVNIAVKVVGKGFVVVADSV